ncbi:type VII secretion integral membrane protein EccD [Gordonia sp. TBRC 11910]|uniref:Type VII secretion integral membrane protein EccD n=1 Tax=Gordonia asplenii TaxID=2725283 RepID=A0A848L1J5_9ACTN|nr:type VII secretion integral membrane protein EccD [Gordonia asplenii]NMO02391.1 type VII secretion integral membrane protein EccD [Gordonia asplenii]
MSVVHPVLHGVDDAALAPDIARVSILGGHTQLDVGLPAQIPIAALLPSLIAQIQSRNPLPDRPVSPDVDDDDELIGALPDPRHWTLAPLGCDPLPTGETLFDAGVRDGDLLALRPVRVGDSPVLFDDVVDALAELSTARFGAWSSRAAAQVGYAVALAASSLAALALVVGHFTPDRPWWPALLGAPVTTALLVSAALVHRYRSDSATVAVLSWAALIFAAAGGAAVSPANASATTVVLSAASVLVVAAVSYRAFGCSPTVHSAVTTATIVVGSAALCQVFVGSVAAVAAVVAAVGVATVFAAPRATSVLAKLPLPTVPTAGDPIDADDDVAPPAIDGIGAVGAVTLPEVDSLAARAGVAQAYLTGISVGGAVVAAGGAVIAASPWSGFDARGCGYAGVIAAVLVLRGRSHTDLTQACALILSGAATVVAMLAGLLCTAPPTSTLALFGCAAALFGAAMVFGVVAPQHDFSPVARRFAELVEYALVVTIVPLLLWLLDLYQIVRSLR